MERAPSVKELSSRPEQGGVSLVVNEAMNRLEQVGHAVLTAALPSGIARTSLQDLMDTLTAYAKAAGYPLKSATFLPQLGDGCVLLGIDLRVRVGMFEEEPIPIDLVFHLFSDDGWKDTAFSAAYQHSSFTPFKKTQNL